MERFDLLVIGGGINGAGIARDAAGRGLSRRAGRGRRPRRRDVERVDQADPRRPALPRILPVRAGPQGARRARGAARHRAAHQLAAVVRPAALARAAPRMDAPRRDCGCTIISRAREVVPGSARIDLRQDRAGRALRAAVPHRLPLLGRLGRRRAAGHRQRAGRRARAAARCCRAPASPRAAFDGALWTVDARHAARRSPPSYIVNAAGPWAEEVARTVLGRNDAPALRLVQGSHLVTRRVHLGRDAFMLQQPDGRIVFVIPYERDFSLIGTTERSVDTPGRGRASPTTRPIICSPRSTATSSAR